MFATFWVTVLGEVNICPRHTKAVGVTQSGLVHIHHQDLAPYPPATHPEHHSPIRRLTVPHLQQCMYPCLYSSP
jgi:hypothetical protein